MVQGQSCGMVQLVGGQSSLLSLMSLSHLKPVYPPVIKNSWLENQNDYCFEQKRCLSINSPPMLQADSWAYPRDNHRQRLDGDTTTMNHGSLPYAMINTYYDRYGHGSIHIIYIVATTIPSDKTPPTMVKNCMHIGDRSYTQ